jgi:hypothetical protein
LGIGINRFNYAQGIFAAYQSRVIADGGVAEAGACVDAVSGLLLTASLLLIPSGYKSGKAYAEIPTNGNGDLTWTRASTAIRTNSSGLLESMGSGVPRLTYQNGGGSCPALLLEPQRTNLLLYSVGGGTGYSEVLTVGVTNNFAVSPDGTTTATRLNGSGVWRYRNENTTSLSTLTQYTFSVYVKSNTSGNQTFRLYLFNANFSSDFTATPTWQRFTFTSTSGAVVTQIHGFAGDSSNNATDIQVWGWQIEEAAYATTYIPTTTASATRVADAATKTGISSLIGQTEGVIFVDFVMVGIGSNAVNVYNNERSATTISTNAIMFNPNGLIECQTFLGNGTFANVVLYASTYTVGQRIKLAFRYKSGDFALYINGVQKATNSTTMTFVGTKSVIELDNNSIYYGYQEGVQYNQLVQFPTALTNAELASLTTI